MSAGEVRRYDVVYPVRLTISKTGAYIDSANYDLLAARLATVEGENEKLHAALSGDDQMIAGLEAELERTGATLELRGKRINELLDGQLAASRKLAQVMDERDAALAQLSTTQAELASVKECYAGVLKAGNKALADLATTQAALEAAQRDAGRYRWLRAGDYIGKETILDYDGSLKLWARLDAAIDAAIAAGGEK